MGDDRDRTLLDLSQRLRILDDAAIGVRAELDDLHALTSRLPPYRALPPALRRRLLVTAERLAEIDTQRDEAVELLGLIVTAMHVDGKRVEAVFREEAKLSLVGGTIPETEPPDLKDPDHDRPDEGDRPL